MLTIANEDGAVAAGHVAGGLAPGVVGFRLTVHTFAGQGPVQHVIPPLAVAGNHTPMQTAGAIVQQVNQQNVPQLVVAAVQNPAIAGHANGSADVTFQVPNAWVEIDQLSGDALQDETQRVAVVAFDTQNFTIRSTAQDMYVGGPMQRSLFRSFAPVPTRISLFVIGNYLPRTVALGHTIASQAGLAAQYRAAAGLENCLTVCSEVADGNFAYKPATLSHEFGHALSDSSGHVVDNAGAGALMTAATSQGYVGDAFDTCRIFDTQLDWLEIVGTGGNYYAGDPLSPLGLLQQQYSMHARVQANQRIQKVARP